MNAAHHMRSYRRNHGLSKERLAEQIGVSPDVIATVERGARPRPANALAIASFFRLTVTQMWPEDDPIAA